LRSIDLEWPFFAAVRLQRRKSKLDARRGRRRRGPAAHRPAAFSAELTARICQDGARRNGYAAPPDGLERPLICGARGVMLSGLARARVGEIGL